MQIGLGVLRCSSETFWGLTLPEFLAALDGYLESHGGKKLGASSDRPMLPNEADREKMARVFELAKRRRDHAANH